MNELDEALAANPAQPEAARAVTTPKARCRGRHVWVLSATALGEPVPTYCRSCGAVRDEAKAKRGKSNRRLGSDQERRAERRYGWEKIGERGEKTDLRGRFAKVQQKASRRPAPALFRDAFAGLDATRDGRVALLLLTFVHPKGTDDYIVIRGEDWLELHGRDEEAAA